jgi:hypothetical protein
MKTMLTPKPIMRQVTENTEDGQRVHRAAPALWPPDARAFLTRVNKRPLKPACRGSVTSGFPSVRSVTHDCSA